MAWVKGTEKRTFVVSRPLSAVRQFFLNPSEFRAAFTQLESSEETAPNEWRWVLISKTELGVTFQGDYTVHYRPDGAKGESEWSTLKGNMRSSGRVQCFRVSDDETEVHYLETLEVDLPIPGLAARMFQPIVSREIRSGVGEFLEKAKQILESQS